MKTKSIIVAICIILLSIAIAAYAAYVPKSVYRSETVILQDHTDKFLAKPDIASIIHLLDIEHHLYDEFNVRLSSITNYAYNLVDECQLPSVFVLKTNHKKRSREINKWTQSLESKLVMLNGNDTVLPNSSIWIPLVREANRLSTVNAQAKNIVAFTDACENTSTYSIYDSTARNLLIHDRDKVKKLFEAQAMPGNLHGITIYIIYQPKDEASNAYFLLMSDFFAEELRGAGATVVIGANLIPNK